MKSDRMQHAHGVTVNLPREFYKWELHIEDSQYELEEHQIETITREVVQMLMYQFPIRAEIRWQIVRLQSRYHHGTIVQYEFNFPQKKITADLW